MIFDMRFSADEVRAAVYKISYDLRLLKFVLLNFVEFVEECGLSY